MMKLCFKRSALFLAAALSLLSMILPAQAQLVWQGSWKTNFGEIHLIQIGNRVFGDYGALGVLEGQLSANSMVFRGTFQRDDGKWGTFHFQRQPQGFLFKGHWRFAGITKRGDKAWDGERISGRKPKLKKAVGQAHFWAHAIAPEPTGSYKAFFDNKPRKLKLPKIPGVSGPILKPQKPNMPRQRGSKPGAWHHGWLLDSQTDAYEIRLEVDHFQGSDVAQVDLSFFTLKKTKTCPRTMHPHLCEEMQTRFHANDVRDFAIQVQGTNVTSNSLKVAWRFKKGKYPYLLEIRKDPNAPTGYRARLYHDKRGLDHFAFARKQPHICDRVPCTRDRLSNLKRYPDQFRGKFNDAGYEKRFPKNKNTINAAHDQRHQRDAKPKRREEPKSSSLFGDITININPADPSRSQNTEGEGGQRSTNQAAQTHASARHQTIPLTGHWYLTGENGETLGTLFFDQDGAVANGLIEEQMLSGTSKSASASIVRSSAEAAIFALTYSGVKDDSARLLITLPAKAGQSGGASLKGSLIQGQYWQLVTLGQQPSKVEPSHKALDVNEADFDDLPGSGVTGPAYRLRSVPAGKSIKLRIGPGRGYQASGSLASEATEILVLSCAPEVNPVAFDQAGLNGKYALLSRSWCEVAHEQVKGYLPGVYLDPILNR